MALGQDLLRLADSRRLATSTWSNSNDGEQYEQTVIRSAHFGLDCLFVSDTERCPDPGCKALRLAPQVPLSEYRIGITKLMKHVAHGERMARERTRAAGNDDE